METNTLILISMTVVVIFIFAIGIILENIIKHNHKESEKVIKRYIDECVKANANTVDGQLTIPVVVKPKGTFCGCGKPYSQKDLEDGMCNKCCAPTGYS